MPEEIGIAIFVIVALIWLTAKILQALGRTIGKASKDFSGGVSALKSSRSVEKKQTLSAHVSVFVPNQLDQAEQGLDLVQRKLQAIKAQKQAEVLNPFWVREQFKPFTLLPQDDRYREMNVRDISEILQGISETWTEREAALVNHKCQYVPSRPTKQIINFSPIEMMTLQLAEAYFKADCPKITERQVTKYFGTEQSSVIAYNERRSSLITRLGFLNKEIQDWNDQSKAQWDERVAKSELLLKSELLMYKEVSDLYVSQCEAQKNKFAAMLEGYSNGIKEDVINRMQCVLSNIILPPSVPRTWDIDFDEGERILIIDIFLPDVVHHPPSKTVVLKKGIVKKPLSQTEKKEAVPRIHPAIMLRVAHEVFRNDYENIVRLLVLNGWVKFDDPTTGASTKAYTASLMVAKNQIEVLNLSKIDPLAAFNSLHGKSAGRLIEIVPIEPTLSLNRKDPRFVDAKPVIGNLDKSTNLAAMDWQDFEHLIRELFEKEFAGHGAEVKITQASRDRGVDAIAFDPDPIHGGKYVIQAKRYTNTVDVSAVRDLCAVVTKEGASRGILVTTSTYGADAYAFANNSPITLLNGAQLLGLLGKHGYTFRIDIREARMLALQGSGKR